LPWRAADSSTSSTTWNTHQRRSSSSSNSSSSSPCQSSERFLNTHTPSLRANHTRADSAVTLATALPGTHRGPPRHKSHHTWQSYLAHCVLRALAAPAPCPAITPHNQFAPSGHTAYTNLGWQTPGAGMGAPHVPHHTASASHTAPPPPHRPPPPTHL
jgi:hypothetical protein